MCTRLLTLTALLVAPLPAFADDAEDRAVEAVTRLGGKVVRSNGDPARPVVEVNFSDTRVTGAGLKVLAVFKGLKTLDLSGTKVTDAELKELTTLQGLQNLSLFGTQVTNAGLKELAALQGLVALYLNRTQVTDA